jgi:signal transduction histidine kinase
MPPNGRDEIIRVTSVEVQVKRLPSGSRGEPGQPDDGPWRRIELPLVERAAPLLADDSGLYVHWFRFRQRLPQGSSAALYIPRVRSGYLCAYFDGRRIEDERWLASPGWNVPLLFVLPASMPVQGGDIEILVAAQHRGSIALSAMSFGPYPGALLFRHQARTFAESTVPKLVTAIMLAFGAFTFGVWWRRRSESTYLLFSGAMLAWSVYLLPNYLSFDGFSPVWRFYWWAGAIAVVWLAYFMYTFALQFLGARMRLPRLLFGYALASTVTTLALFLFDPSRGTLYQHVWQAVDILTPVASVVAVILVTRAAVRVRTPEAGLLALALWAELVFNLYDRLLVEQLVPIDGIDLQPFGALFVFAAFGYAILRRYVASLADVESSNVELDRQLAARTRELEASHARLREVEREQALADERQRLIREMHDGMGSALMSSLVLVEQGRLDNAAVAQVLRENIDDLKLTIDSLEPIGPDLLTLLGTVRYRLGSRLERAGIRLVWNVKDLPPLPWLDANASLQVLRILQEALTNVVKHAQASTIRVDTDFDKDSVVVRVTDDGRGTEAAARDAGQPAGRGLQNMKRRAESLGGRVDLESRPGATAISLRLPRERRAGH